MRQRVTRVLVLVVVGAVLVLTTAARVRVFDTERAVWFDATTASPLKPRVWVNLGNAYLAEGAVVLATVCYTHAIRLAVRPERPTEQLASLALAEGNLAIARWQQGRRGPAWHLIARAHNRLPYEPGLRAAYDWIQAHQ